MKRNATAVWLGTGKEGQGHLTTQSKVLEKTQYSYNSRFAEGIGTNPEELVAAAHAGCFTMKLALNIDAAGFTAKQLETRCEITIENGTINKSQLTLHAWIEGMSQEKFHDLVEEAEKNCPVSKLLKAAISVTATLNNSTSVYMTRS